MKERNVFILKHRSKNDYICIVHKVVKETLLVNGSFNHVLGVAMALKNMHSDWMSMDSSGHPIRVHIF